jgi:hypothetical protein
MFKKSPAELQRLAEPNVGKPRKLAINPLAQESFHGISGTYETAEPSVVPFVELQ